MRGGNDGAGGSAQNYNQQSYHIFYFTRCNRTDYNVYLSLSARRENSSLEFMDEGWFKIVPGACLTLGPYLQGTFYYFAHWGPGLAEWSGEFGICAPSRGFKVEHVARTCAPSEYHKAIEHWVDTSRWGVDFVK